MAASLRQNLDESPLSLGMKMRKGLPASAWANLNAAIIFDTPERTFPRDSRGEESSGNCYG